MKHNTEATQLRMPANVLDYIRQEAASSGLSQNSVIVSLILDGKRFREAEIVIRVQASEQ